jgi:hypothetical protein
LKQIPLGLLPKRPANSSLGVDRSVRVSAASPWPVNRSAMVL